MGEGPSAHAARKVLADRLLGDVVWPLHRGHSSPDGVLEHKHNEKLQIIGVSQEAHAVVKAFVQEQGDEMDYAVGAASEEMYAAYMRFEQYIPRAFLLDPKGRGAYRSPLNDGCADRRAALGFPRS